MMYTGNLRAQPRQATRYEVAPRSYVGHLLHHAWRQAPAHISRCRLSPASHAVQPHQHRTTALLAAQLSSLQQQAELLELPNLDATGGSGGSGTRSGRKRLVADDGGGDGDNSRVSNSQSTVQLLLTAILPTILLQLLHAPVATAASKSKAVGKHERHKLDSDELDAFVESMCELSGPILNNMGFSGLLGAAAAAALKMVGRTLAAAIGMCLILIQVLSHNNVITVHWSVVHEQARQVLDATGDGRLDADDYKRWMKKGLVILSEGVPSVSGFLVGFLVGLKIF